MTNVGQCQCDVAPIVRFINFKVMEGTNTIFLDDFKDKLSNEQMVDKINACLYRHGFKGVIKSVDGFIIYGQ